MLLKLSYVILGVIVSCYWIFRKNYGNLGRYDWSVLVIPVNYISCVVDPVKLA